jgi:energy-coupling factor transporter ATP-binding protein EcfA2
MFTDIRVEKFRGFRELHVPALPQIALLTGKNGSGKSTLLEAVFALYARTTTVWVLNLQAHRGFERLPVPEGPSFVGLFYGMADEGAATITGRGSDGSTYALELKRTLPRAVSTLTTSSTAVDSPGRPSDLVCRALKDGQLENESSLIWAPDASGKPNFETPGAKATQPPPLLMHPAARAAGQEEAERFGTAKAANRARAIIVGVQSIDPTIEDIEYMRTGAGELFFAKRKDEYIPLGLLGGGLSNVFRYLVNFDYARGGFLGIDEVENGIHHSALRSVFRHLVQGAIQANTQLIMSTHSHEAVEALSAVVQEYVPGQREQIGAIHLRRDEQDAVALTCLTGDDLVSSVELGYELR